MLLDNSLGYADTILIKKKIDEQPKEIISSE